jgi:hypothetical protein
MPAVLLMLCCCKGIYPTCYTSTSRPSCEEVSGVFFKGFSDQRDTKQNRDARGADAGDTKGQTILHAKDMVGTAGQSLDVSQNHVQQKSEQNSNQVQRISRGSNVEWKRYQTKTNS